MPFPLFPIQILWINLVTDGLPALALGTDKPTKDLMARPPRKTSEGIITQMGLLGIVIQGLILTSGVIAAYALELYVLPQLLGYKSDLGIARTVTFATLVLSQLFHAYNFRVETSFLISRETFKNMFLNISFLVSLVLQALVIYLSPLQMIFKTSSLNWIHIVVVAAASLLPVIGINIFRRHAKRFV
jgi:Ca2+-transporting ATPase